MSKSYLTVYSFATNIIILLRANPAVICILILALIPQFVWFQNADLVWGDDTNFPMNLDVIVQRLFHIWDSNYALGRPDTLKLTQILPFGLIYAGWNAIGLPYSVVIFERIFVYILFAGAGITMFILLREFLGNEHQLASLVGSIFYCANPFLLILWTSVGYYLLEYAFLPLLLFFFVKGLREERKFRYAIGVAIFWTLSITPAYTALSYVVVDWGVLLLYFLYHIVIERRRQISSSVKFVSILFVSWLGLNSVWLLPNIYFNSTVLSSYIPADSSDYRSLYRINSIPISEGSRLLGYWGLDSTYEESSAYPWYSTYKILGFTLLAFLLPITAFVSIYFWRTNRRVTFFVVLALVAIFLVKGYNDPLKEINEWIFSNPYVAILFRSIHRFTQITALAYAVMISTTIAAIWTISKTKMKRRVFHKSYVLSLSIIIVGLIPWPLWTGAIQDGDNAYPTRRTNIPTYFTDATNWLNEQSGSFTVMSLPFSKTGDDTYTWGNGWYPSISPYILASEKPFLTGNKEVAGLAQEIIDGQIENSATLNSFNIKYVMFTKDSNWEYILNHSSWVSTNPEEIEIRLSSIDGLRKIKTFGPVDIYLNEKWKPMQVYALTKPDNRINLSSPELDADRRTLYSNSQDRPNFQYYPHQPLIKGTYAGEFRFGAANQRHWPVISIDDNDKWNYLVAAKEDGHFGFYDGNDYRNYPVDTLYEPNKWYKIKVTFDYSLKKYWVWIDDDLKTPQGLDLIPENGEPGKYSRAWQSTIGSRDSMSSMWMSHPIIIDNENLVSNQEESIERFELIREAGTEYHVTTTSRGPFYVFLTQTYDPRWILRVDGIELSSKDHFATGNGINGWFVNQDGHHTIMVAYTGENLLLLASMTSSIAFVVCGYILVSHRFRCMWPIIRKRFYAHQN